MEKNGVEYEEDYWWTILYKILKHMDNIGKAYKKWYFENVAIKKSA